jgi:uncharacterized protein
VKSHLLAGKVRHRRSSPFVYELEHDVYYFALDTTELAEVDSKLALVSRNRPNLLGFRDDDHFLPPAIDLDASVRSVLRDAGMDPEGWRITLVTNLRTFGYLFNPASVYLCRDPKRELRVVILEVGNTHHERRMYTLFPEADGEERRASMEKDFYVSPFISMDADYTVRVWDRPAELRIAINEREHGAPLLTASLVLRRLRLTNRTVAKMLVRYPFVTVKTIVMIYWHALRLHRRGARFHRHGEATESRGVKLP